MGGREDVDLRVLRGRPGRVRGAVAGLIPEDRLERAREPLVGFAAGVLIGTALLDMLPEALAGLPAAVVLGTVVATLAAMVLLEWTIGHRVTSGTEARRLAPSCSGPTDSITPPTGAP